MKSYIRAVITTKINALSMLVREPIIVPNSNILAIHSGMIDNFMSCCRMLLQVNYLPLKHVLNKISSFCKIRQPCLASKIELCYSYPHIMYSKQFNVLFIHLVCITTKIYKSCFQCGRKSYPEALKNS